MFLARWVAVWAGLSVAAASGGTFELNTTRGVWQLDGSLNARYAAAQPALETSGFTVGNAPNSRFATESPLGVLHQHLVVNSSTAPFTGLKPSEVLRMPIPAGGNGFTGATYVNEWTIVMDVRFPSIGGGFINLLQDRFANDEDGEIFLNSAGQLQCFGMTGTGGFAPVVSGVLSANTWYRLAFSASYDAGTNQQIIGVYVNGVRTTQTNAGQVRSTPEGRYAWETAVALFSDNNNETGIVHLGALAYWKRTLSDDDVDEIGTYSGNVLAWAGFLASNATPPLPALTGRILYGTFVGNYTPPTGAALLGLADSATASTYPDAVCDVNTTLGSNGGTIQGFPNHRFGGPVQLSVLANGDVVSRSNATVSYTGGGADIGTAPGDVRFTRSNLNLLTGVGLVASALTVYLPAGMNVAMDADTRFAYDRADFSLVTLNQSLTPAANPVISKGNFPNHFGQAGLIYPSTERVPVRLAANNITWSVASGQFNFSQAGNAIYHQAKQLATLSSPATGTVGNSTPRSNDFLFLLAKNVSGLVILGSRAGGNSTVQALTLSLDPATYSIPSFGYVAHHPLMDVKWSGAGSIIFANNAVSSTSGLPGASATTIQYARAVASANCQGQAGALAASSGVAVFLPTGRIWRFTQDGGVKADGSVGATLNVGTDSPSGVMIPQWSGYTAGNGSTRFGHTISGGFTSARVISAGNAVLGSDVEGLDPAQRPFGLLGAGHSTPASSTLIERPGYVNYKTGASDYPGLNLRAPAGLTATSDLAGVSTGNYPLADTAKYYLRTGGVSGLHASSATTPISLSAYGGSFFNLSSLQLSFLDGINKGSGVNGNITVPTPNSTNFTLGMKRVLFGPQGQIQNASLASPQADINLGYWNFTFSPLAIDFPQPKGCPPPSPDQAFVRISARATLPALTTTPVVGTLGFHNSDLVTENSAIAAGQKNVSRFEAGPALIVPGPSGKNWPVVCTTGIYLNQKAASGNDSASLNAGGLMNVPFFNDMEVHLRTPSSSDATGRLLHVREAISSLAASTTYDPGHVGRPDVSLDVSTFLTDQTFDPRAFRKWQNLIEFDYRVAFQSASNTFRSRSPYTRNLLLFPLSQGVKTMTPDGAEILFDGKLEAGIDTFLPQINFSTLATGTPLPSIQGFINPALDAVAKLDLLLSDQIQPLLKPALQAAATNQATGTFYNTLRLSPDRNATIDSLVNGLTNDVVSLYGPSASGLNGRARRDTEDSIQSAIDGLTQAKNLIASAASIDALAQGIGTALGLGGTRTAVETARLDELRVLFDRSISDLQTAKTLIGAPLAASISASFAGEFQIRAAVDLALKDLRQKWAPTDASLATALFATKNSADFAADLSVALSDRIGGSFFPAQANTVLRRQLGDAQFLTRQVLDETLALASSLLDSMPTSAAVSGLGALSGKLASANLKGYAHINGDSLHELRLDGRAELTIGLDSADSMGFDAHFILRDVDSSTPGGACMFGGGAKSEVIVGASTNLDWIGQDVDISLGGKVALDGNGEVIGLFGDLKLVGELDFSEVKLKELGLGFGYGANNYYFYGKGAAKVASMDVAAGIFIGRTCSLDPIINADPDIGLVVAQAGLTPPFTGASVYVFGAMSLMPIIGIPPSCLLDVRVGGGQGFFVFDTPESTIAGFKSTQSVSGELLCIASVTGRQDTLISGAGRIDGGSPVLVNVSGTSRFTLAGSVGYGWLSYDFEKSVGLRVRAVPSPVKFSLDF